MQAEETTEASPNGEPVPVEDGVAATAPPPAKKPTRQWAAWTRQEEENFFLALRQVGKNFEKITNRVQSKNKDQVRHYYYRLIKRMNKLLAPAYVVDAKNTKDANAAMLRWWSLLEKHSCSASKLHLKPRRFKTFITTLGHQLLKDRKKKKKTETNQGNYASSTSGSIMGCSSKPSVSNPDTDTTLRSEPLSIQKGTTGKGAKAKKNVVTGSSRGKRDASNSKPSKQRRRKVIEGTGTLAAYKKWEEEASVGVTLVAEAAEQLERAALAEHSPPNPENSRKLLHVQSSLAPECVCPQKRKCLQCQSPIVDSGDQASKMLRCENLKKVTMENIGTEAARASTSQEGRRTAVERAEIATSKVTKQAGETELLTHNHQKIMSGAMGKCHNGLTKLKLQLFPMDDFTRRALEMDGHNPHLELTLKARKMISSVLQHLMQKWGHSTVASGALMLFPYHAQWKDLPNCQTWTMNDTTSTAGDVHEALGCPPVFRLRYGWFSSQNSHISTGDPCSRSFAQLNMPEKCMHSLNEQDLKTQDDARCEIQCSPAGTTSPVLVSNARQNLKSDNRCEPDKPSYDMSETPLSTSQGNNQPVICLSECDPSNVHALNARSPTRHTIQSPSHSYEVKTNNNVDVDLSESIYLEPLPMDVNNPIAPLKENEDANSPVCSEMKSENVQGTTEIYSQLPSSSWNNAEGTDGFAQRGLHDENLKSTSGCLMSTLEWVDSLTNISLGELLNEASRSEKAEMVSSLHLNGNSCPQDFAHCMDSFDAAIAALSGQVTGSVNVNTSIVPSHSSIWDGEETRDAFPFQSKASCVQESSIGDALLSHKKPNMGDETSCLDGMKAAFPKSQENMVSDGGKQFVATDLCWADSLGSLDLSIRPSGVNGQNFDAGDISISLSDLLVSSLDAFQNLTFFESEKKPLNNSEGQGHSDSAIPVNYFGNKNTAGSGHIQPDEEMVKVPGSGNFDMSAGSEGLFPSKCFGADDSLIIDQKILQSQVSGSNEGLNRRNTCLRSDAEAHVLPLVGASV